MNIERVHPQNIDAERAVLGALLIPEAGKAILARAVKILGNSDGGFYRKAHQTIYKAIQNVADKEQIDLLTVVQQLERMGELQQVGGVPYIDGLLDSVPTFENIEYYAKMVKETALRRKLIYTSMQIYDKAFNGTIDLSEIISESKKAIYEIQESTTIREVSINAELKNIINAIEQNGLHGIPTGFRGIDEMTTGYMDGEFYILAGRPGMGKTAMALDMIINLCQAGKKVMLVSIEMPSKQILLRMMSKLAQIPYRCFRHSYELAEQSWTKIHIAASKINEYFLVIDDAPGASIDIILAKIENEYYQNGLDIAFIDHLHLIPTAGQGFNDTEAYSNISLALKNLARRLNIPVVCLAQLRRLTSGNPRPTLQDLRGSGAIEQNADHVWFLYNPEDYTDQAHKPSIQQFEFIVAKNKSLDTGTVNLTFYGAYMQFKE